jgi:serine protease SohB
MEFLTEYGLFIAKTVTVVVAIGIILLMVVATRRRGREAGELHVQLMNERFAHLEHVLKHRVLPKKRFRKEAKADKARAKKDKKEQRTSDRKRVFVLSFKGDIRASAVASLREEITAVLSIASERDEVLLRLENAGGLVHEHGLAASQLTRIKTRGIPITVAVDKVAASGGYMMACVADKIIAAPFAVLGSIGVLAQIPNFHRLLETHGVEFEQIKAGELKRTLTMFGENTDEDRARLQEQIEDTHMLFKDYVAQNRPVLDMDVVATGEHWHGIRALEHKLVDELLTSDDYLLAAKDEADLFEITYKHKKDLGEKLASVVQGMIDKAFVAFATRQQNERVT